MPATEADPCTDGSFTEPGLVDPCIGQEFIRSEEKGDFALRTIRRIRSMDHVSTDREGEIPANRPGVSICGVRLANHLPYHRNGAFSLERHRDDRTRGDVRH